MKKKIQVKVGTTFSKDRDKELSLSLQIQAYLNTASDELYAKGKPLYSEKRIEDIHKCMKMWTKLHNAYFYGNSEQKPGWSEEDEYMFNTILHGLDLKKCKYEKKGETDMSLRYLNQYKWLKSIKDRCVPQPK